MLSLFIIRHDSFINDRKSTTFFRICQHLRPLLTVTIADGARHSVHAMRRLRSDGADSVVPTREGRSLRPICEKPSFARQPTIS